MRSLFLKRLSIAVCAAILLIFSCIEGTSITYAHQHAPTNSLQLAPQYRGSIVDLLPETLSLQIDFSPVTPPALAGRVTIYQQSGTELSTGPISNGSINGSTLQFTMDNDRGQDFVLVFTGTLTAGGSLSGTWTNIAIVPTSPTGTWSTTGTSTTPAATVDLQTLTIQSLQPLVANSSPTLRANIRNNGSAASGNFNIRWIADGNIADGGHNSIPAGAVDTHDYIWHNLTAGQHTITFTANFDHGIAETDYSNNQFTLTFTVKTLPSNIKPGGMWVWSFNTNKELARDFPYTLIARAYQTHPSDPSIKHVVFTGFWSGNWHVLCDVPNNRPDLGDRYYCTTNFFVNGKFPPDGAVKVSFDVYDTSGNVNYSPNGTVSATMTNNALVLIHGVLNTTGQILPPTADAFDCVASGLSEGTLAQVRLAGGFVETVKVLAQYLDRANIVYVIAQDVSTGKISHLADDISNGFTTVPGKSCNDFLQGIGWISK